MMNQINLDIHVHKYVIYIYGYLYFKTSLNDRNDSVQNLYEQFI